LNLGAIEASLQHLQAHFPEINNSLNSRRETMHPSIVANMMAGYRFVDSLLAQRLDLFAMGNLKLLLEMNALVLCGPNAAERARALSHLTATEQRFYEQEGGGIREVVEWYDIHRADTPWRRAAGVYICILSEPELFIEGNHRTGALVMSYLLAREGRPPFVLTVENAKAYLDPSTLITKTRKHSLVALVRVPKIKRQFAKFLKEQADRKYLIAGSARRVAESVLH
jgi:prophage maintenance system killer protein